MTGSAGSTPPSANRRVKRAVHAAVGVLQDAAEQKSATPSYDDAVAALAASWAAHGPVGHVHEEHLRARAETMMARLAEVVAGEAGAAYHRGDWAVDVGTGDRDAPPSPGRRAPLGSAVTLQVLRSGPAGARRSAGLQALMLAGARARFPDHRVTVETLDPETGDVTESDVIDEDDALAPYREAIAAIEVGDFGAAPGRRCPSCPFFLICGA